MSKSQNKSRNNGKVNQKNGKSDNNNSRGRDSRNNSKSDRRDSNSKYQDADTRYVGANRGPNEISWWNKSSALYNEATKISFMNQLGAQVHIPGVKFNPNTPDQYVPGGLVMDTITCPGYSSDITSPASIAAVGVYEEIRKRLNKPNPDYEPADLAIMIYCISDLYSQYMNIVRAFGCVNLWSSSNLYLPRSFMQALYGGKNVDTILRELQNSGPQLRFRFNSMIAEANSFLTMPANLDLITRHSWLFQFLYMDSHSNKAQLFARRKAVAYAWDETGSTGSKAKCIPMDKEVYRDVNVMSSMIALFGECLELLRNSSSVRIMISDMRQAFGDSLHYEMPILDEMYTTELRDIDEVNMQIENTIIMPVDPVLSSTPGSLDVTQDPETGAIIYQPIAAWDNTIPNDLIQQWYVDGNYVLNIHERDITPEMIMEASRSMPTIDSASPAAKTMVFRPCTDFCSGIRLVYSPLQPATRLVWDGYIRGEEGEDVEPETTNTMFYAALSNFDWAPVLPGAFRYQDLDNYTVISKDQLEMLNQAALYSVWNIKEEGHYTI
nr:putative capsid [Marmot picobirnavirus]